MIRFHPRIAILPPKPPIDISTSAAVTSYWVRTFSRHKFQISYQFGNRWQSVAMFTLCCKLYICTYIKASLGKPRNIADLIKRNRLHVFLVMSLPGYNSWYNCRFLWVHTFSVETNRRRLKISYKMFKTLWNSVLHLSLIRHHVSRAVRGDARKANIYCASGFDFRSRPWNLFNC